MIFNLPSLIHPDSEKLPTFLYCDSIGNRFAKRTYKCVKNLLKEVLIRQFELSEDIANTMLAQLRHVRAKLPLQNNYFDCGVYVLEYVEQLLSLTSVGKLRFNEDNVTENFASCLTETLFKSSKISNKRNQIKKLIRRLRKKYIEHLRKERDVTDFVDANREDSQFVEIVS